MLWRVTFGLAPVQVLTNEVANESSDGNASRTSGGGLQDKNRLVSKEQLAVFGFGIKLYPALGDEVHEWGISLPNKRIERNSSQRRFEDSKTAKRSEA